MLKSLAGGTTIQPFSMTYKPGLITNQKLCQTDLEFGLRSEFIGRSVHAGLPVSTRLTLMICATLVNKETHTSQFHTDRHTDRQMALYISLFHQKHGSDRTEQIE